jgi:hypothetical protein
VKFQLFRKPPFEQTYHFFPISIALCPVFEREVFLGIDFTEFRSWMFGMEARARDTEILCHHPLESILFATDYR